MASGLGLVAWVATIAQSLEGRGGLATFAIAILLAAGCAASARVAIKVPVQFSVDERGVSLAGGKRFVPWDDVEEIRVAHYKAEHYLTLKLKPGADPRPRKFITFNKTNPDEVEVNLGQPPPSRRARPRPRGPSK